MKNEKQAHTWFFTVYYFFSFFVFRFSFFIFRFSFFIFYYLPDGFGIALLPSMTVSRLDTAETAKKPRTFFGLV
ncbi:hypothetical protein Halhy_5069 [Haliscomenobacter hydrossis DSM 1100]|uniref:Uncharacterized protein n=1 Tax=Haliscomenobacter hydrossis (strain ATCC 27775 / DSM 1100 / LMG 10767 / O) TaxID=760192 RepID=F4L2E2_HALH1|nr:hypothetical protein Halhy_5069 [Haliscomenobacter hydrossis DSM 1100]